MGLSLHPLQQTGYDMRSNAQSKEFLAGFGKSDFEYFKEAQPRGMDRKIFQYTGVSRLDETGIVQIWLLSERLANMPWSLADIENLADGFRIGNHGSISDHKNTELLSVQLMRNF
jgi:hypothetical protein